MTAPTARDRGAISGLLAGTAFVGGVAGMLALSEGQYPRPGSDAAAIRGFFTGNRGPVRVGVAGQLLSAAALARFTATVVGLARRSGSRPVATAALLGGAVAVSALTASAGYTAALTADPTLSRDAAQRLHRRAFTAGGPVHGAGFGLLVGALGLAGRRTGALSDGLVRAAVGSAVAGLLSPLSGLVQPAMLLIPAGRFSGLVVSGIAGVRLARPTPGLRTRRRRGKLGMHGPVV
jgi:hypothetical protein